MTEAAWMSFQRSCPEGSMSSNYFISLELLPLSSPITCSDLCHSRSSRSFLGCAREGETHGMNARSISTPSLGVSSCAAMDHQHNHPSPHPQPRSIISFLVNNSSMGTGCSQRLQQVERPLWMWKRMWATAWYLESDTLQGSVDQGKRENKSVEMSLITLVSRA